MTKALDALYAAHEFIESVTGWVGNPDDLAETLGEVEDVIQELEPRQRKAF